MNTDEFVAGYASGPKKIQVSIAQGMAASAKVSGLLSNEVIQRNIGSYIRNIKV